ncbi:hypothetical protein AB6N23_08925 [Cellulomonas sp. 179-A 9B4 NHS]|uniref:hypothetical protein n=1 Tax=Cellulomonas sp. 179-A 9B4 NHS TaxID=3142379 RepID=UPI0039A2C42D
MSAPRPERADPPATRTQRWATLTPDALEDEIEANRRGERWVVVASAAGALATAVAVVLQAVTR